MAAYGHPFGSHTPPQETGEGRQFPNGRAKGTLARHTSKRETIATFSYIPRVEWIV